MKNPSQAQLQAMRHLLGCVGKSATLGAFRPATVKSLVNAGWVTCHIPEAITFAQAARGRMRFYHLTDAGERALQMANFNNRHED